MLAQWILDPNLPDGVHQWRPGFAFRKEGLRVVLEGTNTLAGRYVPNSDSSDNSAIPFEQCVQNLSHWAGITFPEALVCATYHPAQMLGGEIAAQKGRLEIGCDADMVVFGWDGKVRSTWIMGKEVYRAPDVSDGDVIRPKAAVNGAASAGKVKNEA